MILMLVMIKILGVMGGKKEKKGREEKKVSMREEVGGAMFCIRQQTGKKGRNRKNSGQWANCNKEKGRPGARQVKGRG